MTLNQIIAQMVMLAKSHRQIRHVYFADIVEWLSTGRVQYPAMFFDLTGAQISGTNKSTQYSFELWFCDMTNVSAGAGNNEIEVMSDLTAIAEDYAAMLKFDGFAWYVGEESQLSYFREQFTDSVAAVRMTVTIAVPYLTNRCPVPTDYVFAEPKTGGNVMLNENGEFILHEDGTIIKAE